MKNQEVGGKIKTFEVIGIKDGIGKKYSSKGKITRYRTKYLLLLSPRGEERVLEVGKENLGQCERYFPTFGQGMKYKNHSMV